MPENFKKLRIFAASPSDVINERAKLETVVDSLKPMADYLGLTLEVVDWRAVVPDTGRPQQIIFDQLKPTSWDIFIGILWHRFGTPPGAKDKEGKDYLSGTEEEFKTAYELWKQHGRPRMVLYRCTRGLPFDIDPDQLKHVREFFKLIEDIKGDYLTLYQTFDTTESFENLLLDNLQKLLIEYGEQSKTPITPEVAQTLTPKIPNNLPRRAAFFGRAKEMSVVMRTLSPGDRTWGVLVDGIGGIGKSALAVEAAHRAQDAGMFDAFIFVSAKENILSPSGIRELTPAARTLDEFLNETARVLGQPGIPKLTSDKKRVNLLDVLRTMRALLIYDNLETLSKEEQEAMADFLRELPQGCKAIITSRRRGGEGSVWLRVEKLDWNAAHGIIENEIARDMVLENKLRQIEERWQELYDETNGSPLVLVYILGLMRVRTALTLDSALSMLRSVGCEDDLMKFVYREVHKELTTNDKVALGTLSFFIPSSTFDAWMKAANLSRNALETTIARLSALSLLDVLSGEERYALHPLTRTFVRNELISDTNIATRIGTRVAKYWIEYAIKFGGEEKESYKTYDKLELEWLNLEATANWLWEMSTGNHVDENQRKVLLRMLIDLAKSLRSSLWYYGRWDERINLSAAAYETACILGDWSAAGWRAYDVAFVHFSRARATDATTWAEKSAQAWARGDSNNDKAAGAHLRGLIARQREDYEEAGRLFQETLAIARNAKRESTVVTSLNSLGTLAHKRGDYPTAHSYYVEALELAHKIDDKELEAMCMLNLGSLAIIRQKWGEARSWFEQQLPLAMELTRRDLIGQSQYGLACVAEKEGREDLALPLAEDALKIYERLQHRDLLKVRELVRKLKKAENKSS